MPNTFVGLLNTSPFFATRPFLATLLIGLVARFTNILEGPAWFLSNTALAVMAILAIIELVGTKTDLGRFLDEFTPIAKGALNFLLVLILVLPAANQNSSDDALSSAVTGLSGFFDLSATTEWGIFGLAAIWPVLSGISVWILAWLRSSVLTALIDLDEDDDLGIQGYFSWIEDAWTITGVFVALLFPMIALAVYALTLLGMFITQRVVLHIQEKRKVACSHCQTAMIATALYCPSCNEPNVAPKAVGLFGQALEQLPESAHAHYHNLITRKRCPVCATRLPGRRISQHCPACSTVTFPNEAAVNEYLDRLRTALPRTLAICLAMSFIPVLGILPGVIYYRLAFISSMRGYIQRRKIFLIRWALILFNILLVSIQWIPFIGALSIPIMCLTNYWVYRRMFRRDATRSFSMTENNHAQIVGSGFPETSKVL